MSEAGTAKDHKDFFISYTSADREWAEWIALELEKAGYHTIIQAWDFRPGSNFLAEMDEAAKVADRTIAVLSPKYFESDYTFVEWAAAFRSDPKGKQRKLLPIRVQHCNVEGLLGSVVFIDLVGQDEQAARERLLEGIRRERNKPNSVPFPTSSVSKEILQELRVFPGSLRPIWNIPYLRNDYFTGREEILAQLHTRFKANNTTALSQRHAMSGLGGIGKTQIAVQYAHQHRQDYQAVLWARAESHKTLTSSFVEIATLLDLPQKDEQDQTLTVNAVKCWLQNNNGWLLILDNADEPKVVRGFLPTIFDGHILLTTRAQALGGLAQRIEVDTFTPELGALFLLRRATIIAAADGLELAASEDRRIAMQISEELGGLPLALDQAGAYIEETACSLSDYLKSYRTRRTIMLNRRGNNAHDYPPSVATTWSLSFEQVEQNSAAADLLRLCAFLAPDAISEEIIIKGASYLGEHLQSVSEDEGLLNEAIAALRAYSLIRRDAIEKTLSIHRLVQAVLRGAMTDNETKLWAERTVLAVSEACPAVEFATWPQWERCLSHAQACADLVEQGDLMFVEAARLLNDTGLYLRDRGQYTEAEPLLVHALLVDEKIWGPEHPELAIDLNNLALLYDNQGKYEQAKSLHLRALDIRERVLGHMHLATASSLNNLAGLYRQQGKDKQAELLFKDALDIRERMLGHMHPDTAMSLWWLARLKDDQELYQQAYLIFKQTLGEMHPTTLNIRRDLENDHPG